MSKPRFLGALLGTFSLIVVAFAALPSAQAETVSLRLTTPMIPVGADGTAKVWGVCMTSTTCKGWIGFSETDDPDARVGTAYSVPAGKGQYVTIRMRTKWSTNNGSISQYDPYSSDSAGRFQAGTDAHQQPIYEIPSAKIQVNPTGADPQAPWATRLQTTTANEAVQLTTPAIAIDENGDGKVWAVCRLSTTCKGWIGWNETVDPDARRALPYSIPAKSGKYITVGMRTESSTTNGKVSQYDPYSASGRTPVGTGVDGQTIYQVANAQILLNPTGTPVQAPFVTKAQMQMPGGQQKVAGNVSAVAALGTMTQVRIELQQPLKGGSYELVSTDVVGTIAPGQSKAFEVTTPRGSMTNNVAAADYKLKVVAYDDHQRRHEWWWRGTASSPYFTGGARYPRTATAIKPALQPVTANFRYGSISGDVTVDGASGQDLSVAAIAAPHDFSSGMGSTVLRELDVESCGDAFARVRTEGGSYRLDFLPAPGSGSEDRFMVYAFKDNGGADEGVKVATSEGWRKDNSAGGKSFGSCYQALDFEWARQGMQLAGSPLGGVDVNVVTPENAPGEASIDLTKTKFGDQRGTWSDYSDQWVMFRKYVPGLARNDSPVMVQGMAGDSGPATFKLPPGRYWVETGRRGASCAMWYPSVYPDNNAYFKGEDRGAEKWKVVKKGSTPTQTAKNHGYGQDAYMVGSLGSGKAWMYREYCKTINEGTVTLPKVDIAPGASTTVTIPVATGSIKAGAVVSGKVTRAGGKSNKEMMVRLSSTDTAWGVIRADLTDSGGKFYVAGLPSGTYKIQVNSDSWRGIGRSFTGTKTITVKAGKSYSAGTLYFSG